MKFGQSTPQRVKHMGFGDKFKSLFKSSKVDIGERFEILREAISGTMSKFHQARDRKTDQVVGLKICDLEKTNFFESRFKGLDKPPEGEIASLFEHPLIVKTLEHGTTTNDEHYVVMEYLEGPGLNVCIKRQPEVFLKNRLKVVRDMATALGVVHEQGYIHRDVCPRNFIYMKDGSGTKLIDFGLTVPATKFFLQPGNRTGTPNYMAPEIIRRKATDHRVDIFAFGVTAFQTLTLQLPWPGEDVTGKAAISHDTKPPTDIMTLRPQLDPALGNAVMACLQRNAADRPQHLQDFLRLIEAVKSQEIT